MGVVLRIMADRLEQGREVPDIVRGLFWSDLRIESSCDKSGRWIAEIPSVAEAHCVGSSQHEVVAKIRILTLRIIAGLAEAGHDVYTRKKAPVLALRSAAGFAQASPDKVPAGGETPAKKSVKDKIRHGGPWPSKQIGPWLVCYGWMLIRLRVRETSNSIFGGVCRYASG